MCTHDFACHDCVCKCRRHKGVEIRLIAFAIGRIPPSAGGLSPGHFGGALTWVPTVRLSKQKPDTLIRTSSRGWNNTSPATSASFPCTRPSVSRYKVRSGRRSAHVHLWCNSTTRLRHFLNSSIDRNLGFARSLYRDTLNLKSEHVSVYL